MKLYLKILGLAKKYWGMIALSITLSLLYIMVNNFSLWISVDFINELFLSRPLAQEHLPDESVTGAVPAGKKGAGSLPDTGKLYQRLNELIKRLIIREARPETLKIVCLLIFFSFLLKNTILYIRSLIIFFIQSHIVINLRNSIYQALIRLPLSYLERRRTGEFTSIAFTDVSSINKVINQSYGRLVMSPFQLLANLTILLLISWKFTLISMIVLPVSGFLITKIGESIRRKSRRVLKQIANVMSVFQESMSSIRIVKAFTSEERESGKFRDANYNFYKLSFRSHRLSALTSPINEILGSAILVLLLWYGGNIVFSGTGITAADFTRFLVFLFMMFKPLKDLSGLNNTIQTGLAAAERIFSRLEEPQEVYERPGAQKLEHFRESIIFKDIRFAYNKADTFSLQGINLTIRKGETIALVGHSGAGKSTLADLILRFYDPGGGTLLVDGIDARQYTLTSLRQQIGIVTQESILFNDTVRANIAYGAVNFSDEKIIQAAQTANAWEFIKVMEQDLDTVIGERGTRLSGGQKQRLSLARAIMKDPPILILDEATSSLDTESERLVQEAIEKLMLNRTIIAIAHRLSTVLHADKIVVLDQGKIIDTGNHQALLKSCPVYRKLYELQFREPKVEQNKLAD